MTHDRIAVRAYYLTLNHGLSHLDAWLEAELHERLYGPGANPTPYEATCMILDAPPSKVRRVAKSPLLAAPYGRPTTPKHLGEAMALLRNAGDSDALKAKRSAAAKKGAATRAANKAKALAAK